MIRLAIVVEGETEEEFVNKVLAEHLRPSVEPKPILLGGDVGRVRVSDFMANEYCDSDFVTSLVDYYGFKNRGDDTVRELETWIDSRVEEIVGSSWDQSKAFAYVQQYEFEGLLFSDVSVFPQVMLDIPNESMNKLREIRSQFPTPEHINDSPDTAPSKRLEAIMPRFHKRTDGPLIAAEIGIETMRAECERFDAWLTRLENL